MRTSRSNLHNLRELNCQAGLHNWEYSHQACDPVPAPLELFDAAGADPVDECVREYTVERCRWCGLLRRAS